MRQIISNTLIAFTLLASSAAALAPLSAEKIVVLEPEPAAFYQETLEAAESLLRQIDAFDHEIAELFAEIADEDAPDLALPQEEIDPLATSVESQGGCYYDSLQSLSVYMKQVELRDPRLNLDCERLYLLLPTPGAGEQEQAQQAQGAPPQQAEQADTPTRGVVSYQPLQLKAEKVFLNVPSNTFIVLGEEIELKHERGELKLVGGEPRIYFSQNEKVLCLLAEHISGFVLSAAGERTEFRCSGSIYLNFETDELLAPNHFEARNSSSELICQSFNALLHFSPVDAKNATQPFSLLTRTYHGIEKAWARKVQAKVKQPDAQNVSLEAKNLYYQGADGRTILFDPKQLNMSFGENQLHLKNDAWLYLEPNGSILAKAQLIDGSYQRSSMDDESKILRGTLKSQERIEFDTHGLVKFPTGLEVQDDELNFNSDSLVIFKLLEKAQKPLSTTNAAAKKKASSLVLPELMISRYAGLESLSIPKAHFVAELSGQRPFSLKGESMDFNIEKGFGTLRSAEGGLAELRFASNLVRAQALDQGVASIELKPNGDIKVLGEQIEGELSGKTGKSLLRCREELYLNKESGELFMANTAYLRAEQGEFRCAGALNATLLSQEPAPANAEQAPQLKYPQLQYDFTGLSKLDALGGSAVRTAQASLQCDGPLHLTMREEPAEDGDPLGALLEARAQGNIRLAGKDSTGRLLHVTGNELLIDGLSGIKTISGPRVTLSDAKNTHVATGAGASVVIDKKNNARIRGEHHRTQATGLQDSYLNQQKTQKP